MNNLMSYIKCDSIVKQYIDEFLEVENVESTKYQHFITRLGACPRFSDKVRKYKSSNIFTPVKVHLNDILGLLENKNYKDLVKSIKKEDSKGFYDALIKENPNDAAFIIGMTLAVEYVTILHRNHVKIDKDVLDRFTKIFDNESVKALIKHTKENETLQEHEGTICINSLGYLMYIKNHMPKLIDISLEEVEEAFAYVYGIYRDKCKSYYRNHILTDPLTQLQVHNTIYGLTHGVLNCSEFYTRNPWDVKNKDIRSRLRSSYRILYTILRTSHMIGYKNLNADALAEILLCIKMLDPTWKEQSTVINALRELDNRYDYENHIIVNRQEDKSVLSNEHTNILYIMLHSWDVPSKSV